MLLERRGDADLWNDALFHRHAEQEAQLLIHFVGKRFGDGHDQLLAVKVEGHEAVTFGDFARHGPHHVPRHVHALGAARRR